MLRFGNAFYALLLSTSLIQYSHCQPINTEPEKPAELTDSKKENETASPAFTYNYPTGFPRDFDTNPFQVMQEMLASMEKRFKSMFGNGEDGMFGNSSMFGNGMNGIQSSSSVFTSSNGGSGIDSFFGPNFFQQPCQQNVKENELVIKCNVTAYDPNEVKVDVKGNMLTISGKHVESTGDENGFNSTTQFQQSLQLVDYNMEKMNSEVTDGLLVVTVPRDRKSVV